MRREELASKSPRFIASDAAVCVKNTKHLVLEAHHPPAAVNSSSTRFPPSLGPQSAKNGGRIETFLASVKPRTTQGVERGRAAQVHDEDECVNGTDGRRTRLHHSFSDSDLHRLVSLRNASTVDSTVHGLFVPWTIRTINGLFVLWNVRTVDCSYPSGLFVPWTVRTVPGLFVPWTIRTITGRFVPC